MTRAELIDALRSMPHTQIRHVHHEVFRTAADMLEADARDLTRTTVVLNEALHANDALRALIREVVAVGDVAAQGKPDIGWRLISPEWWARLTEASKL